MEEFDTLVRELLRTIRGLMALFDATSDNITIHTELQSIIVPKASHTGYDISRIMVGIMKAAPAWSELVKDVEQHPEHGPLLDQWISVCANIKDASVNETLSAEFITAAITTFVGFQGKFRCFNPTGDSPDVTLKTMLIESITAYMLQAVDACQSDEQQPDRTEADMHSCIMHVYIYIYISNKYSACEIIEIIED